MLDFAANVKTATGPCIFSVGQAGYIIKSKSGSLLAVDLYLSDCVERLEGHVGFKRLLPKILDPVELDFDVIICTHPHWDHFDVDAVPDMMLDKTQLFCSADCEALVRQCGMDGFENHIQYIKPGDKASVQDFDISFINCDHGTGAPDAVGVVVRVDGYTFFETGDTCLRLDRVNEMPQSPDVLIAPINGEYGNMNSRDVIELARALKAAVTVPCHYGMFASHGGNLKEFYDLSQEYKVPVLLMRQGEQYRLGE